MSGSPAARVERYVDADSVVFDGYDMKTWYPSPYPLESPVPKLWVCAGCLKYMRSSGAHIMHQKTCPLTHPPGRRVYQRGAHIVWEIDGAISTLYAQHLSLLGKLFIDHKTVFFDVEPFQFYVLTDAESQFDHVLAYFSKEKISYDDCNLACIVTLPPYQRKGYGMLLIELSYCLSRRSQLAGTPERPLSALGLKGYIAYWTAAVLRTLQRAFDEAGDGPTRKLLDGHIAEIQPSQAKAKRHKTHKGWQGELDIIPDSAELQHKPAPLEMCTRLEHLAAASGLRVADTTLGLANADLLTSDGSIVISRESVAVAAKRVGLKPQIIDEAYLL